MILAFPSSAHLLVADCRDHRTESDFYHEKFNLSITLPFNPKQMEFKYCESNNRNVDAFLIFVASDRNGIDTEHKSLRVNPEDKRAIEAQFELAWNYNKKDKTIGMDGSVWCLETKNGGGYTKGCFWTPSADSEERGLNGLHKLGVMLWNYAKVEAKYGALY